MDIKELQRKLTIFHRGGASPAEAREMTQLIVMKDCTISLDDAFNELEKIYKNPVQTVSDRIRKWVLEVSVTNRDTSVTDVDKECRIVTDSDRLNRRQVLHRMCKEGILQPDEHRRGVYNFINDEAPEIDIDNVDVNNLIDVQLPFRLSNFQRFYAKNLIVVAGDTDSGKSAFLMNILALNNDGKMPLRYFNSEMGAEELRSRMDKVKELYGIQKWNFKPKEKDKNFHASLDPNGINVIDYLELTENHYLIAEEFKKATAKLKKGIAIYGIQKKFGAELGYGAESSLWKARLYLSMSYHKETRSGTLLVKKAKNPKIEGVNIKDWQWEFDLVRGTDFVTISEPAGIISNEPI